MAQESLTFLLDREAEGVVRTVPVPAMGLIGARRAKQWQLTRLGDRRFDLKSVAHPATTKCNPVSSTCTSQRIPPLVLGTLLPTCFPPHTHTHSRTYSKQGASSTSGYRIKPPPMKLHIS